MIINKNIMEAWSTALELVLTEGVSFKDSEGRICKEAMNLTITVLNPSKDIRKPIEELTKLKKWTYPDFEELKNIMLQKSQSSSYEYTYGHRIFNFNLKDQIHDFLKPLLTSDPTSRRGFVSLWDPEKDSNIENKNIPGLVGIYFKKNKGLDLTAFIRSNDIFVGWPANIYQLYCIQEYVAKLLGFKIGKLTTFSTSAHVFEDNINDIRRIINRNL